MIVGNVVRLEPDKEQTSKFFQFTGAARWTWNFSKANYDTLLKEKNIFANEAMLKQMIRDLRDNDPDCGWLNDIPEAITKQAVKDLLKAYQKAYKERKKHAYDPKDPGKYFPKFKKKFRCRDSFYQRTDKGKTLMVVFNYDGPIEECSDFDKAVKYLGVALEDKNIKNIEVSSSGSIKGYPKSVLPAKVWNNTGCVSVYTADLNRC